MLREVEFDSQQKQMPFGLISGLKTYQQDVDHIFASKISKIIWNHMWISLLQLLKRGIFHSNQDHIYTML